METTVQDVPQRQEQKRQVPLEWFVAVKRTEDGGIVGIIYSEDLRKMGDPEGEVGRLLDEYEKNNRIYKKRTDEYTKDIERIKQRIKEITTFSFEEIQAKRVSITFVNVREKELKPNFSTIRVIIDPKWIRIRTKTMV